MPTLKQEFIYFNDAVGRTLPNAKMYFYEAGTTTPKNTFTSKSLANANQHPVVADAAGRFPVIWLGVGGYRVVVEDENGVTIHDRDDINVADEQLNATSSIYFNTLADLKLLIAQNGQSVNPGIGDALRTAGETTTTDDLGAEWVVVAAGTGTADDDLFVDLDNGLQAERVFNQFYTKNLLSEITDDADKTQARVNLGITHTQQIFTASGTWTKPTGCRFVKVECVGGGGGSGGTTGDASPTTNAASGGGGGGAYASSLIDVTSLASATVTIGAGGAGGASGSAQGVTGGDTSFNALVIAKGGIGSPGHIAAPSSNSPGGNAGPASSSTGDFKINGGPGERGFTEDNAVRAGYGGAAFYGFGAKDQQAGSLYGSGGGGRFDLTSGDSVGFAGADGVCIVTEFY